MSARLKSARKGARIAVIEEMAEDIYSLKFILQSLGYQVRAYSSSQVLLAEAAEFSPQLVIVDMMMAGREAFHVLGALRQGGLGKDVPILAITADAMQGEEEDVFAAGGNDVLAKPYSVGDLQEKLNKWLPQREE